MIFPDGKPYYSLNYAYKNRFGKKTAKISLDGGFTCPNRDGTLDTRGCLFCSQKGSGDFSAIGTTIAEQIVQGKSQTAKKWQGHSPCYIAYFQAFTNTYAPVETLKKLYEQALSFPEIVGLSIATRPDCLPKDVLAFLSQLNHKTALSIELGFQTAKKESIDFIRRGYDNTVFEKAVFALAKENIETVVHIILGLPNETKQDMLSTINYINQFPIQGVKLQLLHVLKGTDLAQYYQKGLYTPLTLEEYTDIVCDCIEHLRSDIVIHRLTGDGAKKDLIAPLWSLQKRHVLNTIHKTLKQRHSFQGKRYPKQ
ncbi:MAG TPA: TIGR01212 family radical SAM protein [Candidatus Coprocola pullicola]|nr:TIGR01212 family radical SAM protein [Candidatus Coprocola pullicola]